MRKVLIANRGEIAVRIARACRDAGRSSVAVYADPDLDSLHVKAADEAYALDGDTPAQTYLDIGKIIEIARRSGADAVHPGYGFLAENAGFARAVADAGLTWIGPPPAAIDALGDKVRARDIAKRAGAPLAPGTDGPVADADEIVAFAASCGLPVAIKAAYGGGGRGLKVARTMAEIPELYESAVREAVAAFGNGECFAERYLDKPRHVETQCLADAHGNVVVISTRDCSLQRRHQKLVEEAPAPFLTPEQEKQLYDASKAILREAGYVGAGTCEFLVAADGAISFLEVNTRLQVEHPVSEEVTGLDLVREMFRIADGEELGYDDPPHRGHSIEFRINAEDPARNFLPAPGTLTAWDPPSGPGVRLDGGYTAGDTVPGSFDSLIAKLIVTGATREQALQRSRRALAEFTIAGMPTVLPFHRAVVSDPAFAGEDFTVHTRWIETEFTAPLEPQDIAVPAETAGTRTRLTVEVGGKRLEVTMPAALAAPAGTPSTKRSVVTRASRRSRSGGGGPKAAGDSLVTPMQGTIVKIVAPEGSVVSSGDTVVILEAMKMEQPLAAHKDGTVTGLSVKVGQTVAADTEICKLRASPGGRPPAVPSRGTSPGPPDPDARPMAKTTILSDARRPEVMSRIPGDPNAGRWVLFAVGFRLPPENREWVRHELTDAGWRGRTVRRLFVLLIPVCVALSFLPGPVWLRVTVPALALIASVGTVLISADDIRAARLHQHNLPVPDDKDLGHPPHLLPARWHRFARPVAQIATLPGGQICRIARGDDPPYPPMRASRAPSRQDSMSHTLPSFWARCHIQRHSEWSMSHRPPLIGGGWCIGYLRVVGREL